MSTNKDIVSKIIKIFDDNELEDLKSFMYKRHFINNCNLFLIYFFHFVQSAGILVTTIAAGYNKRYLIWIGIGLNVIASLINVYEKINNNMLKKLMVDIKAIKDGNYIDESQIIDLESNNSDNSKTLKSFSNNNLKNTNITTPSNNNSLDALDNSKINVYNNENNNIQDSSVTIEL